MEGPPTHTGGGTAPDASGRPLALVTGASAGIGRVFSQRLAERGHDLILVARDAARLSAYADELSLQYGVNAEPLPADLARDEDMRLVAERISQSEHLAFLVNNAGFGTKGKFVNRPVAEQATMLKLHMLAPMLHTRAALPGMIARGSGTVINVSSVASFIHSAGNVNYCATKAYLRVFTEGLALELAGTGVYVQALCPGFTRTEFHDRAAIPWTSIPGYLWLNVNRVVDYSLAQADRHGATVCVPGLRFKLIVLLIKYLPDWLKSSTRAKYGKTRV
jgi:short-subunit dehydrogenase